MQLRKDGTMRKWLIFIAALALAAVAHGQLSNLVFVPYPTAPTSCSDQYFQGYFNTTTNIPYYCGPTPNTWTAWGSGGGGGGSNPVGGQYAIQYYATSSTLGGSANATVDASGNGYFAGELTLGAAGTPAQVSPTATIVANLPAASTLAPVVSGSTIQYTMKYVHDESSCGPPVVGGGTTLLWVYSDGTNWICSINPGTGTITGVTAGTGLSGGGSTGTVTVSLATPVSAANGGTGNGSLTFPSGTATIPQTICSGTVALGTSLIASGAAATTVTATCTGLASTDVVSLSFNSSPLAVTGYVPSTNGILGILAWPTTNTINISVFNNTASSITPGAITLNFRVTR
jgi:hypothetical protein